MPKEVMGKVSRAVFNDVIYPNLGVKDESVVLGPTFGVDFGVVRVGDRDLIVEVDPVYVVPEYGWERSAWFAVHILASDVAVSGVPPRYAFMDLNLPLGMSDDHLKALWMAMNREFKELGVAVVAGHTGRYGGIDFPMIGGATMVGVTERDKWVSPSMVKPGDAIIMTKGPAIETAGVLASMFQPLLEREKGAEFAKRAANVFWMQSVVKDALTLSGLGLRTAVHAMHDATEYGVWGALIDMAEASGVGIRVHRGALFVDELVMKVLNIFSELTDVAADPFSSISEGTLIAAVGKAFADEAVNALSSKGIRAAVIGEAFEGRGVRLADSAGEREVAQPEQDPFWPMFFRAMEIARGEADGQKQ